MGVAPTPVRPRPWITLALIAINLAVFVVELAAGAGALMPSPVKMVDLGANLASRTLDGEPWRLLSSMFLHYGLLHIAMNMLGLWSGGRLAETLYGRPRFAVVYLLSGLAGGLATVARSPHGVSAGASGAIFGVFGAIAAFLIVHRERFDPVALRRQLNGLALFLFYNLLLGASVPAIDLSAHVGGLAGGFLVGLALEWRPSSGRRAPGRVALVAALGLGGVAAGVHALPPPPPSLEGQVYQEFERIERETLSSFRSMVATNQAGTLADVDLAARIERELLPPWQAIHARLQAIDPPARMRALHEAVLAYVEARVESWRVLAEHWNGRADQARVDEVGRRLDAAFQRVRQLVEQRE